MKGLVFIIAIVFSLAGTAYADDDSIMLEGLHRIRIKQQGEETVLLMAQIFKNQQEEPHCSPVQQVRQRIRDVGAGTGKTSDDDITINAGHEQMNVTDNHGTINSDVNVNVIRQGRDRDCL